MHGKFDLFHISFYGFKGSYPFWIRFFYIFMHDNIKDILRNIEKWKMALNELILLI